MTIRDLGADNLIDLAVRDGINQGILKGPRMLVSGLSGTSYAAECLGLDDKTGTLEAGKYADILAIEGNPLDNMDVLQDLQKIRFVMKEGKSAIRR